MRAVDYGFSFIFEKMKIISYNMRVASKVMLT